MNNIAIITAIDEHLDENLENDFIKTLYGNARYKGELYVIDYGMKSHVKKRIIEEYPVKVFTFNKTRPVYSLRYQHIPETIKKLPDRITQVMLIDSGDVWFQYPINEIFEQTKDKIGFVEEAGIIGDDEWISICLSNLNENYVNMILENSKGKKNKNAGMFCGPRDAIYQLCKNIFVDMKEIGIEFFGLDQLLFNYEMNKLNNKEIHLLDSKYNYVLVANPDFIYKNQKIYTKDAEKVIVVHNAGGNWRIFNRKYGPLSKCEEQYLCNISRRWD